MKLNQKQKGFTVLELIFVVAILVVIGWVIFGFRSETKCIGGYVFTNKQRPVQIMDENGHGIRCDAKK